MNWIEFWARFMSRRVIVYADFIDPFGYIGLQNLWGPLAAAGAVFDWRGFELNPQTPPGGMLLQTAENSDLRPGMWASVRDYAQRSGLQLAEPRWVPNTRRAQLLVRAAPNLAVKKSLIERIYRAYFSDQKDIGDRQVLQTLAEELKMPIRRDEPALAEALPEAAVLEKNRDAAKRRAFPGMPGFAYRGKTYFGALSEERWNAILKRSSTKG